MHKNELLQNRIAFVTGATGAIGKAIARQMAERDFEVVLVCRNEAKASKTTMEIIKATGNNRVSYKIVDLSRRQSIRSFAQNWDRPLHVLVNNAGATPRTRQETAEGIELQFATNVLGYFWMVEFFDKHLKDSAPSRVVNVASYWAGDLDLDDLEFKNRRYNNGTAYRQSKQANRMLTVAHAQRLAPYKVSVNVCHPGDVNSQLSNNLGFGGHETPDEGARTPVWLAISPVGQEKTGKYFSHMREERCRFGEDLQSVDRLYNICAGYS